MEVRRFTPRDVIRTVQADAKKTVRFVGRHAQDIVLVAGLMPAAIAAPIMFEEGMTVLGYEYKIATTQDVSLREQLKVEEAPHGTNTFIAFEVLSFSLPGGAFGYAGILGVKEWRRKRKVEQSGGPTQASSNVVFLADRIK